MKKIILLLALLLSFSLFFQSCDIDENELDRALGWLFQDENTDEIENAVNLGNVFGSGNLPSQVDLMQYFPPIGDQGQYGTCVAWAVGYNHKSFLEAKAKGYTNYTDQSKMFSPKDLFWAIPNSNKGDDCNGTNFAPAYNVLINRGIARLSVVPYTSLGDCSQSPESSWTNDAANHKIESYRQISVDKNTIKSYLAGGEPVVFGAKLGDQFMNYTSGVLDYQTYGYSGQHAYHAMILAGYDDSKGANGAFKVVNSWGSNWGQSGIIWVDQDFFCNTNDFCFCAFIATDVLVNPDEDGDNQVDDPSSGYDLIAWDLQDYDDPDPDYDDRWRIAYYNVYNGGENTVYASDDWCIVYLLYNAYDGNEYQVILFDYYSDDYGYYGENGQLDDPNVQDAIPAQGYWWNHVDVVSGQSVSDAVFGTNESFQWGYKMPAVTGYYYLVIYADAFNTFIESSETNNFAYFTAADGGPLYIIDGVIQNAPTKSSYVHKFGRPYKNQIMERQSVKDEINPNAYTTYEISQKLIYDRQTGELQKKVLEYMLNPTTKKQKFSK